MRRPEIARRAFLRGLGAGAGCIPLLRAAPGRAGTFPKRLVVVVWTNGAVAQEFWPQGAGTDLGAMTFPSITASLGADPEIRKRLLFVNQLEIRNWLDVVQRGSSGHYSFSTMLTGTRGKSNKNLGAAMVEASSASIDQVIADALARRGGTAVRSLHLAVLSDSAGEYFHNCCTYREGGLPVVAEADPARAAARLFGGPGGAGGIRKLQAEKKSLLDFVARDLDAFVTNLGVDDRMKVQAHLDSVRELETRLARLDAAATACPTAPAVPPLAAGSAANYPALLAAQQDVLVGALACDLTRVATLQLGNNSGNSVTLPGYRTGWHAIAHAPGDPADPNPENQNLKARLDRWFIDNAFTALLKKFMSVKEGEGTMLDNTVILFANHISDGHKHTVDNLPWLLAGSCGGAFQTGRFVQPAGPTPTNHLFSALARAMDVPLPDDSFGDPEYRGMLSGLG